LEIMNLYWCVQYIFLSMKSSAVYTYSNFKV
jgi:hypothetical protein